MNQQKFDIGEIVHYDHPGLGKGYGVIVGYNSKEKHYHISPRKKKENIIICLFWGMLAFCRGQGHRQSLGISFPWGMVRPDFNSL